MKYSIDMIRFKFSINHQYIQRAIEKIKTQTEINLNGNFKEWTSTKPFGYRYNIVQEVDESSIYLGLQNNTDSKQELTGAMEYNPNKMELPKDYMDILKWSILNDNLEVLSFDVAVDFKADIKTLKFINPKRSETIMKSSKGKTHYFGKSRYSGYTRVYDKAKEQGSKEILTRYETRFKSTLDYNDIMGVMDLIQGTKMVEVFKQSDDIIEDKTLKAILYAVRHGYDYKELTRSYKNKVKAVYSEDQVNIDKMEMYKAYILFIQRIQDKVDFDKHEFRI